jgi:hypothetical protein
LGTIFTSNRSSKLVEYFYEGTSALQPVAVIEFALYERLFMAPSRTSSCQIACRKADSSERQLLADYARSLLQRQLSALPQVLDIVSPVN